MSIEVNRQLTIEEEEAISSGIKKSAKLLKRELIKEIKRGLKRELIEGIRRSQMDELWKK